MNSVRISTVVLFSVVMILQGCGQAPVAKKSSAPADSSKEIRSLLESQLGDMRKDLAQHFVVSCALTATADVHTSVT